MIVGGKERVAEVGLYNSFIYTPVQMSITFETRDFIS